MSGARSEPADFRNFEIASTPIEEGITLIEASAGTGKTYSLTSLAVRMLLHEEVRELREVLLVTFTDKATAELKARLRQRLVEALNALEAREGESKDETLEEIFEAADLRDDARRPTAVARLRLALTAFDEVRVQTLHGFCGQLLRESAFELGEPFTATFVEAATDIERQALEDSWRDLVLDAPVWWAELLDGAAPKLSELRQRFGTVRNHRDADFHPPVAPLSELQSSLEQLWASFATDLDLGRMADRFAAVSSWGKRAVKAGSPAEIDERLRSTQGIDPKLLHDLGPKGWIKKINKPDNVEFKAWMADDPLGQALSEWSELVAQLPQLFAITALLAARARYARIKERDHLLDYDDLIDRVYRTVVDPRRVDALRARVQSTLKVGLIDEFQDTDRKQWTIFEELFAGQRLVLVGDPKQAIYAFRGADLRTYLRASRGAARRTTLEDNWRSHPQLVEAVNMLFGRFAPSFVHDGIRFPGTAGALDSASVSLVGDDRPPLLFDVLDERFSGEAKGDVEAEILRRLVGEVVHLLGGSVQLGATEPAQRRDINGGDMAVLVRKREQGQNVIAALRAAGVTAVLAQPGDIYDSAEMRDLELILRAVLRPRHTGLRQRAAATLVWSSTLEECAGALGDSELGGEWARLLQELHEIWQRQGFVPMCGVLLRRRDVRRRLLALEDGERRWTNVHHAIEILDRDALDEQLDAGALIRWIGRQRDQRGDEERRQLRLERDTEAVKVLTMHKCKGLQFEVVFCPFLYGDVRKPTANDIELVHGEGPELPEQFLWRVPTAESRKKSASERALSAAVEVEHLAEDLRLLYVAVTRAQRRCVIWTGATGKDAARSALSFLIFAESQAEDLSKAQWWEQSQRRAADAWGSPRQSMQQRCAESEGRWGLLEIEAGAGRARPKDVERPKLEAAEFPAERRLARAEIVSFTSWTRNSTHLRAQDHLDPQEEASAVVLIDALEAKEVIETAPSGIFAFSRGARAGLCLHEVLERVSWQLPAGESRQALVEAVLQRYGLSDPAAHRGMVQPVLCVDEMLSRVARMQIPGTESRFAELDPADRRAEFAFDAGIGRQATVSPRQLAAVFREHASGDWVAEFTARLALLPAERIRGILTGFIDLVFRAEGRWWVLDWKSNHFGNHLSDYGDGGMQRSMLEHNYHLQYHLYLVALHRHLRRCQPDYDPGTYLGGSIYVYLRGLDEGGGAGCVIDRPPVELIEALDRCLDGELVR
jgi:exodeoxyribonuclease V beta subunit